MTSSLLDRLATDGITPLSPADVQTAITEAQDRCDSTGDARFCVVSDVIKGIDDWRLEHDEAGGVRASLLDRIDTQLKDRLPRVLAAATPAEGTKLARALGRATAPLLLGPRS